MIPFKMEKYFRKSLKNKIRQIKERALLQFSKMLSAANQALLKFNYLLIN
jgi:hypothetical protein